MIPDVKKTRQEVSWRSRPARALAVAATLLVIAALPAHAAPRPADATLHLALTGSTPAAGDTVDAAPAEVRLVFTEAVRPELATVSLWGPEGEVPLSAPGSGATGREVVVRLLEGAGPGSYMVRWRVVGSDGHPVAGEIDWVVRREEPGPGLDPGADADTTATADGQDTSVDRSSPDVGPAAPGRGPPPASHHPSGAEGGSAFDAESPAYVAVRWLTFAGLLGVLGAAAYGLLVLPLARRRAGAEVELEGERRGAARVGLVAAAVLVGAVLARGLAQSYAVHGGAGALDPGRLGFLLTGTLWGWAWLAQLAAAVVAVVAFGAARGGRGVAWLLAGAVAAVLAFTPALSGHAAAATTLAPLPVLMDGLHVLGAGGWLGSLLVLLVVGVRRATTRGDGDPGIPLAPLVAAFSATALAFAALLVATGLFSAWLHLPSVPALWETEYGRVLLLKLGLLLPVFATGAYNWRRVRPALEAEAGGRDGPGSGAGSGTGSDPGSGAAALRRAGLAEVAVAALVLLATAILVATPTPDPVTHEDVVMDRLPDQRSTS